MPKENPPTPLPTNAPVLMALKQPRVFKVKPYQLSLGAETKVLEVMMPEGANFCTIGMWKGAPVLWALAEIHAPKVANRVLAFRCGVDAVVPITEGNLSPLGGITVPSHLSGSRADWPAEQWFFFLITNPKPAPPVIPPPGTPPINIKGKMDATVVKANTASEPDNHPAD